jgi:hypothetical protein
MKTLLLVLSLGACVEVKDGIKGTQSLRVDLKLPTDPGSRANRLADTVRNVSYDVTAIDQDGAVDTTYTNDVQVYVQYLGTLTPYLGETPLATVHVVNGKAVGQTLTLPSVFGPTTLWLDDSKGAKPTYATGASTTLWFRDPFIADLQRPSNEMAVDALTASPLQNKNVLVDKSRYGANGRIVVTSVFAQGYTIADMSCGPGGAPPCLPNACVVGSPPDAVGCYDSAEIFSFSAPKDQNFDPIVEGQTISGFAGGVTEFNGLTEIGFPQSFVDASKDFNPAREPAAVVLDPTWFSSNKIMFERNEAGPIQINNGKVCPLDADFTKFMQWKLDPSGVADAAACGSKNLINIITTGVIQTDPATLVGKTIPRVVGIVRPVSVGTFNVWIIFPRGPSDFTF